MKTIRIARTAAAGFLGFTLVSSATAQDPAATVQDPAATVQDPAATVQDQSPQITGQLHLKITDGKGVTKEYHLSKTTPLPVDLLPLIDLLKSEDGVKEVVRFAEQSMHTWSDDLMRRLALRSEDRKPWLGVAVQPVPAAVAAQLPQLKGGGLIVRDAAPGGPAATAGLQPNDVLTTLNDQLLFSEDQLSGLIGTFVPGDEVTLKWIRGAGEMTARAALAVANPPPPRPVLGPEATAYIERQFGPEFVMLLEAVAANPMIIAQLPVMKDVIKLDEEGKIRWNAECTAGLRKHLEAHAPELLPGYDTMMLELASDPDIGKLVNRLGVELKKASPEFRQRIVKLFGKMLEDLMGEIEKQ